MMAWGNERRLSLKRFRKYSITIMIIFSLVLISLSCSKTEDRMDSFEINAALDFEETAEKLRTLEITYDQCLEQLEGYVTKYFQFPHKSLPFFIDANTSEAYSRSDLTGISEDELDQLRQANKELILQYNGVLDDEIFFSDTFSHEVIDSKWVYSKKTYRRYSPDLDHEEKRIVYTKYIYIKVDGEWKLSAALISEIFDSGNQETIERQEEIVFSALMEDDQLVKFIHSVKRK